jgi:hypothetical protein
VILRVKVATNSIRRGFYDTLVETPPSVLPPTIEAHDPNSRATCESCRSIYVRRWHLKGLLRLDNVSSTSATTSSSRSTPLLPTGAAMPNSAKRARIELTIGVCRRLNRCRVRRSIRQLCCSGVMVGTNRMLGLVTASQIAFASAESFLT